MSTAAVASFSSPPLFPCSTFRHPGPAAIRRTSIPSDEKASIRPAPKKMNQAKKKHWTSNHRKRGIYGHQLCNTSITRCLILELPRKTPQPVSFQPLHHEAQAQAQSNGSKARPTLLRPWASGLSHCQGQSSTKTGSGACLQE
ncbi:hypothetical protein V3481_009870 [Fusarium oxysporum f. sp. vasinfectum]